MAQTNPIVVGGGVSAGSPFALGHLVYVTNVNPPQLSSYGPLVSTDSGSAVVYTDFPNSAGTSVTVTNATETVRILGGLIVEGTGGSGSVAIGAGATVRSGTADQIVIGRAATAAAVAPTGAVVIGAGSNGTGGASVIVGRNSGSGSANPVSGVFIGDTAQASGNAGGANVVCIGDNALIVLGGAGGGGAVAIGAASSVAHPSSVTIGRAAQSTFSSSLGQNTVTIGDGAISSVAGTTLIGGASSTSQTGSVVIGSGATATGAGTGSIVIGQLATSGASQQIVIGASGASLGANIAQIGTSGTQIVTLVIGAGNTIASPAAKGIRFTNASGTDNAAGNLTIQAPLSTGAATPATIIFTVGAVAASSATLQTATTVMTIGDQIVTFAGAISAAGLPTSAGAADTLWVDTGAGNVIKRA